MKTTLIALLALPILSLPARAELLRDPSWYNALGAQDVFYREAKPYVPVTETDARIRGEVVSWVNSFELREKVGEYFGVHIPGLGTHLDTILKTNALNNLKGAIRGTCLGRAEEYQRRIGADDGLVTPEMIKVEVISQGAARCHFDREHKYAGEVGGPWIPSIKNEQCTVPVEFSCSYPSEKLVASPANRAEEAPAEPVDSPLNESSVAR